MYIHPHHIKTNPSHQTAVHHCYKKKTPAENKNSFVIYNFLIYF
jgi:hypothetical protein